MIDTERAQIALGARLLTLVVCTTGTIPLEATATGYQRSDVGGSFVIDGFRAGMELTPAGFPQTDIGVITGITDTTLDIDGGRTIAVSAAGRSLTVGLPGLVEWENTELTRVAGRPYLEEEFSPSTHTVDTFPAQGASAEETGEYYLRLYGLTRYDVGAIRKVADAIRRLFAPGTTIPLSDGSVMRFTPGVGALASQLIPQGNGWTCCLITLPYWALSTNGVLKATMPGGDVVFELIPEYDTLAGVATSGQRFTVVGSPVVDGDHYDMGPDDALVFGKGVLPVNESASGFTVFTALDLQMIAVDAAAGVWELATPDGLYFPAYAQQTNEAGHNNFYVGVTYTLYADNPSRQEEYVQAVDVPAAPCVIAIRFDRRLVTGSRLSVFVDGVLQAAGPGSFTTGDNTEGLFAVPPTSLFYVGIDPSDEAGGQVAPAFGGYTATIAAALSDTVIAQRCAWIAATHPVTA